MDEARSTRLVNRLRAFASDFVQQHESRVRSLTKRARELDWSIFAFGGVPRGLVEYGARYIPRDLDLVFDDASFEEFTREFSEKVTRRTRFGGLHLFLSGLNVDAWPLSATWAFREKLVKQVNFESLPKTTFLNLDGIVIQFATSQGRARAVYASGLEKAKESKTLDIELLPNPFPPLCVIRAIRLADARLLPLAPRLAEYCFQELSNRDLSEFVDTQISHYKSLFYTVDSLKRIRLQLEKHINQTPLFSFFVSSQGHFWENDLYVHTARDQRATQKKDNCGTSFG